ncbi:hypothetical protein [uncultured Brevundimonas sp.]|uniref:hypothetical protein n=1 Tax=uncultured Brevundimonas sp. TaxID=213418 RepID=UPI0025E68998|nr:hypothetical protein [uncultured Brevundimonas sp.]
MTFRPRLAALTAAFATAFLVIGGLPAPAAAQSSNPATANPTASSVEGQSRSARRNRTPPRQTPEQIVAGAQAVATAASINCQVTQANLLGQSAEGNSLYEAACATGPGYLLVSSTPPIASDCVLIAAAATTARAADPAANVGPQCTLPANQDSKRFIMGYAVPAGVTCTVDDGAVVGRNAEGAVIYEIGCAGTDGYHIRNLNGVWSKDECIQVISRNLACNLTTPSERFATVKGWLAGSDAATCDVQDTRYMGTNTNGSFYEVKCAAGDGYIARLNDARAVQQVYPCATAQRIGDGCKLTTVATVAPPAAATEQ